MSDDQFAKLFQDIKDLQAETKACRTDMEKFELEMKERIRTELSESKIDMEKFESEMKERIRTELGESKIDMEKFESEMKKRLRTNIKELQAEAVGRLDSIVLQFKDKVSQEQFMKLFNYIEEFKAEMISQLENKTSRESVDHLTSAVDSLSKYYVDHEVEQVARDAQFDRLLKWAKESSKKTGVPLKGF